MGAYLNKPVTEKEQEEGENDELRYASTSMQGWRAHQEDAHNCLLDFAEGVALFGVYDGHGGSEVAQYVSEALPAFLKDAGVLEAEEMAEALKSSFVAFDDSLRQEAVVQKMGALKGSASAADGEEQQRDEEDEREALFEEAVALSREADVSLETIIRQYAKIRSKLQEESNGGGGGGGGEGRGEKRLLGEPSSRLMKRRRIHRENATSVEDEQEGEEGQEEPKPAADNASPDSTITSSTELRAAVCEWPPTKVNGSANEAKEKRNGCAQETPSPPVHNAAAGQLKAAGGVEAEEPAVDGQVEEEAGGTEAEETVVSSSTSVVIGVTKGPNWESTAATATASSSTLLLKEVDSNTDEDEEDEDYVANDAASRETDTTDETDTDGGEASDAAECESEQEDEEDEEELNGLQMGNKPGFDSGATACVALVLRETRRVVVANVGDSRAVLCRGGRAVDLSVDHKPEDPLERERIERAGGCVNEDGRVNGGLNLSRALGDHFYKRNGDIPLQQQMITALPDVVSMQLLPHEDTLLVVACDGIWNSLSSQEVIDFVNERLPHKSLKEIGADICTHCCAADTSGDGTGCDNMTIVIIDLTKAGVPAREAPPPADGEGSAAAAPTPPQTSA